MGRGLSRGPHIQGRGAPKLGIGHRAVSGVRIPHVCWPHISLLSPYAVPALSRVTELAVASSSFFTSAPTALASAFPAARAASRSEFSYWGATILPTTGAAAVPPLAVSPSASDLLGAGVSGRKPSNPNMTSTHTSLSPALGQAAGGSSGNAGTGAGTGMAGRLVPRGDVVGAPTPAESDEALGDLVLTWITRGLAGEEAEAERKRRRAWVCAERRRKQQQREGEDGGEWGGAGGTADVEGRGGTGTEAGDGEAGGSDGETAAGDAGKEAMTIDMGVWGRIGPPAQGRGILQMRTTTDARKCENLRTRALRWLISGIAPTCR